MITDELLKLGLSRFAKQVLTEARSVRFFNTAAELAEAAVPQEQVDDKGYFTVGYDIEGRFVPEAKVCRVRNGISANYIEPYMRRRDPNCMVIADDRATDKQTYESRFGKDFEPLRQETFQWLKTQDVACFFFDAGLPGKGLPAMAICPANAAFFAFGLATLQGIVPLEKISQMGDEYYHSAIIYIAPPFRHTHFDGRQVVVHNRREELHELFSYNLYPGPSAKKGVYGMLLNFGERDGWNTAHCSTVQVLTPYDNSVTMMHEGASGGGKSEMLEQMHRELDGRLKLGVNLVSGERRYVSIPRGCELRPVTDDMALCHPEFQNKGSRERKLTLTDAEQAWFLRVNHITEYGTDPHLESLTMRPKEPLLFLNIDAAPGSTALIWEPIEDEPGEPCPNPRLVFPRVNYPGIVNEPVTVDIRSFGVRCPPCTRERPTYGIIGLFHILPASLAWLWRLVAPRGHGNPSIVATEGMSSEGVGSYWPFATGRRVDQANILFRQVMDTPDTMFLLIPNQHIGCWQVGLRAAVGHARVPGASWLGRIPGGPPVGQPLPTSRSLAAHDSGRGSGDRSLVPASRNPARSWAKKSYDRGAEILTDFFHKQIRQVPRNDELDKKAQEIIRACLDGATVADYDQLSTS